MKKLLHLYDTYALKFCVVFLILFTALYPKLPSVHIIRTWVYIRLEDFFILATAALFITQFLRRKVLIPLVVSLPIFLFWFVGLLSTISSLIYIRPVLQGYFPHIVFLNFLRRIEYMVLFFIAFSSVKSVKDIKDYIVALLAASFFVMLYGLGQHYYISLWAKFPAFFEKYPFCFPSFQTGNEEFAKGIPLCLDVGARITSSFGGHYDLAAYLVMVMPIILLVALSVKRLSFRLITFLLFIGNLALLILTASRVSFIAYLIASILGLILYKKKLFIIPVLIISFLLLITFSESTARRLLATFRFGSIVTNMQGQLVGEVPVNLPTNLKNKIAKNQATIQRPSKDTLPVGSGFIGLPQQITPVATSVAIVRKTLSPEEIKRLNFESGDLKLSTVSGNFIIRNALVYDISFTTRFQAEWPNAWKAFLRNPLLGSGYSTITLATDNDYFRALGETGLLGLLSFLFIFVMLGISLKEMNQRENPPLVKALAFGIAGGTIGLMLNALLIDVFEASKVAENLWMFLGIAAAGLFLTQSKRLAYRHALKKFFSSYILIGLYLISVCLTIYLQSINNFFTGSDFTWLRWGASASTATLKTFYINSANYFYTPLPKTIIFLLYTLFSFQPQGYHIFILFLHFASALGVFFLANQILKKRLLAFLASVVFLVNPIGSSNIFSLSMLPVDMASVVSIYALICFILFKQNKSMAGYIFAFLLACLSFLCHPLSIILPCVLIISDLLITTKESWLKRVITQVPFVALPLVYFIILITTYGQVDFPFYNFFYLASVATSLVIIFILDLICRLLSKNLKTLPAPLFLIFAMAILIPFYREVQTQNSDWNMAGNISKNMLTDLRIGYEGFKKTTDVYFVNAPSAYNDVALFPNWLTDSLWFIYQQNNPRVHIATSVSEARNQIIKNPNKDNYIFTIQKDGSLRLEK